MPRDTNWPADLSQREIENSGYPEPHETYEAWREHVECLWCGEIHQGDCAVPLPAPESYAAWRERTRDRADAERDRAPGKW